jgi:hypothetical protein
MKREVTPWAQLCARQVLKLTRRFCRLCCVGWWLASSSSRSSGSCSLRWFAVKSAAAAVLLVNWVSVNWSLAWATVGKDACQASFGLLQALWRTRYMYDWCKGQLDGTATWHLVRSTAALSVPAESVAPWVLLH